MAQKRWILPTLTTSMMVAMAVAYQNCGEFKLTIPEGGIANQSIADVPADVFSTQPASKLVSIGGQLRLETKTRKDVSGYQWYFKRLGTSQFTLLASQTSRDLTLDNFDGSLQGDYKQIVRIGADTFESQIASVAIPGLNNSCLASSFNGIPLPLAGEDGVNWTVNGYVDVDLSVDAAKDYTGNAGILARAVDGQSGMNFALAHFKAMDAGVDVKAIADGVVESLASGNVDRNLDYSRTDQNYIRVRLLNGYAVTYGFLKKDSINLKVGDSVTKGQAVGQVGASGATNLPQLRLEILDCAGQVVDPMLTGGAALFAAPPVYDALAGQLDLFVRATPFTSMNDVKLISGPSLVTSEVNKPMYFAGYFAHIHGGDEIRIEFKNPSGVVVISNQFNVPGTAYYGIYNAFDTFSLPDAGTWKMTSKVNGVQVAQRDWVVTSAATPTPVP